MAKYPQEIVTEDHLPTNRGPATPLAGNHSENHNRLAAEVRAIQLELGIRPHGLHLIDVSGATLGQVLKFDGTKFAPGIDLNDGEGIFA